jgi:ABC-type lipoprotein release transport system permease subunit
MYQRSLRGSSISLRFIVAVVVLIVVAAVAAWISARRVARVEPPIAFPSEQA